MKLSDVQVFQLREALRHSSDVLRQVKQGRIHSRDRAVFEALEGAVQNLELVQLEVEFKPSAKRN